MRCNRCGECCGPVFCSEGELEDIREFVVSHDIDIQNHEDVLCCPFFHKEKGCLVYLVRPFLCRLFGHVPAMRCASNLNVNISVEEEQKLMNDYLKIGANRMISEVLEVLPFVGGNNK